MSHDITLSKENAMSNVRIRVRDLFEIDPNIKKILSDAENPSDVSASILEILKKEKLNESVLEEVLGELLGELDQYKNSEPGLYLVDSKTGKSVIKLREGAVYQPPDYIGEDGIKRRAKPILHPGISVPLTMLIHEEGRLSLAKEKPGSSKALTAVLDPTSIIREAEFRLQEMGYEIGPVNEGFVEKIEIGREYYDPLQSKNDQFHRHFAFGAILAKKIMSKMQDFEKCELVSIESMKNSKQRWYEVSVKYDID